MASASCLSVVPVLLRTCWHWYINDIHHVVPRFTSPIRLLLSSGTRCYGFPVAGSIDRAFRARNQLLQIRGVRPACPDLGSRRLWGRERGQPAINLSGIKPD